MLSQVNSVNPSFGQVTCIKIPRKAAKVTCNGPKELAEQVTKAFNRVAPDLGIDVFIERHSDKDYYCPNITNVPMILKDDDINICVVTGKEHEALKNKNDKEFFQEITDEFEQKYGKIDDIKNTDYVTDAGKEIFKYDAMSNIITSKFRALFNLEGKEVPVIKINSLDDITYELAEKIK